MNSKEALKTIGNVGTKFVKSDKIGEPMIMYKVKELKKKEFNIIKESLKRLEQLEKENQNLKEVMKNREEGTIELIKAIIIMKAKLVPILLLQEVDTPEEYNEGLDDCDEYRLTQEEFDLLKQVFESVGDSDE